MDNFNKFYELYYKIYKICIYDKNSNPFLIKKRVELQMDLLFSGLRFKETDLSSHYKFTRETFLLKSA